MLALGYLLRMRLVVSLALVLATAAAAPAAGAGQRATVHGIVTRGPLRPVCVETQPCEGPAARVTLRFVRNGRVVARAETASDGSYRVRLRPGQYRVWMPVRSGVDFKPRAVRVRKARSYRVDFSIDTGIR